MNTIDLNELKHLKEINKRLVTGFHISENDIALWHELESQQDAYEALFEKMGYRLLRDSRGFFYFDVQDPTVTMGKISRLFALSLFCLIEHYADSGKDPMQSLFDEEIDLELCQTLIQNHYQLYEQLEITTGSELRKDAFQRMLRFGLAKETASGNIKLLAPVHRYLDALMNFNHAATEPSFEGEQEERKQPAFEAELSEETEALDA